jgi:tetratricopeptide (TPR) repeat protein
MAALLAAAALVLFRPVLHHDFVRYDDPDYVTENARVLGGLTWSGAAWAFGTGHAGNWHPLTWMSHMLDVRLFGLDPGRHHLTSALFHAANSALLFLLLHRLTRAFWRAAFVAAVFALHPLHVESVAWVSERKDVLSTFFFLLTLLAYGQYASCRQAEVQSKLRLGSWYAAALVLFALGLMSKAMLVTVPFLLLLLDYWPLERLRIGSPDAAASTGTAATGSSSPAGPPPASLPAPASPWLLMLEKLPFFALAAGASVVTLLVQQRAGAVSTLDALPLGFRISNAVVSYARYVFDFFWPTGLAVFYPLPQAWPLWQVAGAALLVIALSLLAIWRLKREPYLAVGWFWFLGTLVPVIGLVQVGQQAMADRYMYIPLIGLAVALAWGAAALAPRFVFAGRLLPAAGVLAVVACAWLGAKQVAWWRDNATLFARALAVTRDNAVAHNNLGVSLVDEQRFDEAESHFTEAVRLKPNYADALVNLGISWDRKGRREEAFELFETAARTRPTALAHYNLGNLLLRQGKVDEAGRQFAAALRLKPSLAQAWYNLGIVYARQGKAGPAAEAYRSALALKPGYTDVHLSLGALLAGQRDFDRALPHFQEAIRLAPDNADAHFNLAGVLSGRGDPAGAAYHLAQACRLRPNDTEARESLAIALLNQGKLEEAAARFQEVLHSRPTARAHYYNALALDALGRPEKALPHYREAARLNPGEPLYLNDLAWLLATNPKPELRNGVEAVHFAHRACELAGEKEARFWGTLDAAYAEAGLFDDAIKTAAKTRALALAAGQRDIADRAGERQAFYRAGKPYRVPTTDGEGWR